jgi:hypothetical protein
MSALSRQVGQAFADLCTETYLSWSAFCHLFPTGINSSHIKSDEAGRALAVINRAMHEHFLYKVCKLHDPAVQFGEINLGIEYIIKYGGWGDPQKTQLQGLQIKLDNFAAKIKSARNKILSHNDLKTILDDARLGGFDKGDDAKYFDTLQEFTNIIYNDVMGSKFSFPTEIASDATALLKLLQH